MTKDLRYFSFLQLDEADLEAELAALGDELGEMDSDTAYLDEALNAPTVPADKPAATRVSH